MRKFMVFCLIITIIAGAHLEGYNYNPQYPDLLSDHSYDSPYNTPATETEYFIYTAPDDINDSKDAERLAAIIRPQKVVFIKNPDKNLFSLTAEELAKQKPINIYVLNRQTKSADLLSQLQEIRERVDQKPNVKFVNYRTSEDIDKAKQAIYKDFDSIPGSTIYHEDPKTPVYNFDSKFHKLYLAKEVVTTQAPPVVFEIIRRPIPASFEQSKLKRTTENLAHTAEIGEYLPPKLN